MRVFRPFSGGFRSFRERKNGVKCCQTSVFSGLSGVESALQVSVGQGVVSESVVSADIFVSRNIYRKIFIDILL